MLIKRQFLGLLLANAIFALLSYPAFAFYSVQDTGELLNSDEKQLQAETQFVTSGDQGINFIGRFDMGINEESNFRAVLGTGTTDILIGAFYKWVPFPDFDKQPAIGFTLGAHYARYEDENELSVRLIPIASKKFDSDIGLFIPFLALPIALSNYDSDTETIVHLSIGSRYRHPEFEHFDFTAEIGIDISDAFSYISIGAVFPAF